jgi:hypothetical protein
MGAACKRPDFMTETTISLADIKLFKMKSKLIHRHSIPDEDLPL